MNPPDWVTLRIFLAALDLGSVTKAADQCGIAVSAAAKRIQDLELDHGVRLLERTARGVRPTAAGDMLAGHARSLFATGERLRQDLMAAKLGGAGRVRVDATTSVIAGHDLAEQLAEFRRAHPGIGVSLSEETSLRGLARVVEGRSDLAFITTAQVVPEGIAPRVWRQDRLLVAVPTDHPLAGRSTLGFLEVLDWTLVGVIPNGALSLMLDEAAQRLGRTPDYGYRVATADAAMRLVAAGLGVSVMPDGVMRVFTHGLGVIGIPLDEPWATREIRLVARLEPTLTLPARLLLQHLDPRR